jgi:hypothetical protein
MSYISQDINVHLHDFSKLVLSKLRHSERIKKCMNEFMTRKRNLIEIDTIKCFIDLANISILI